MAKKNLNPADAFRKAQRKKELKKNKAGRTKARDLAIVKKDTTDLETVIRELEADRSDSQKLAELKAELEKINKKKAEYVAEHPEARRLVYRKRREGEPEPELPTVKKRNPFKKNGLPKHPERSIYYDPVLNPFGVAPPGMPYIERPLLPGEVDSEEEDDGQGAMSDDDDDDIKLPPGLPPGSEEVNSDDDIQMPDDPPPGHEIDEDDDIPLPPPPPGTMSQPPPGMSMHAFPPGMPPNMMMPNGFPPPPPPGFAPPGNLPPPPFGFPPGMMNIPPPPPPPPGFAPGPPGVPPPPPFGFPPGMPNMPPPNFMPYPNGYPPFAPNSLPPPPGPPPKFLPRQQSMSAMQDPLSTVPHQTFQAHKSTHMAPPHPSLPQNPNNAAPSARPLPHNPSLPAKPVAAAATVVAAPQLRDLKREATAFVPSAVKRKKAAVAETPKFNAAPDLGPSSSDANSEVEVGPAKPDLLSTLQSQFGPKPVAKPKPAAPQQSDYDKFMAEMGDILGPQ